MRYFNIDSVELVFCQDYLALIKRDVRRIKSHLELDLGRPASLGYLSKRDSSGDYTGYLTLTLITKQAEIVLKYPIFYCHQLDQKNRLNLWLTYMRYCNNDRGFLIPVTRMLRRVGIAYSMLYERRYGNKIYEIIKNK